ncbi:ribbon-helix-helix domain-containing protein [Cellulomonas dongxiuzhuiae]|uniref:Ribbon-helix-helix domain-containing protein n=1 Tax=Cellulomonas dongxiuzhuiae TaxID=2819979 RepID=A0ABX8GIM3_9CELL|nr:ribbon-helix-helix domain-containing protein [Cellulomonas dongxiuzhuiae]MBO3088114.1 ribbon-helix-helix protein, CopG family [Cellulomonas dongxiuzhuiae]MBO3094539.1 ribbon-helix-helix protein, CopG family [Cellulomonas dongxiuzhuiae]QWC15562.1 ribbon-helix-helix domain-containing protein [Cellulomonas dongxiuzhuiae]
MTIQITVRLDDDLVQAVDALVAEGRARSRAAVVEVALERHLRRELATRDVEILRGDPSGTDLDALAAWSHQLPAPRGLD